MVIGRLGSSAILPCETRSKVSYVHWYRQQVGKAPQRLLRLAMFKSDVQWDSVLKADKVTAMESKDGLSCTLSVLKLERSDEGLYYCAAWDTTAPHAPLSPVQKKSGVIPGFLDSPGLLCSSWPLQLRAESTRLNVA